MSSNELNAAARPMSKRRTPLVLRVAVLALIVLALWTAFGTHVKEPPRGGPDEPGPPAVRALAERYTRVPLPPEARDVGAAGYSHWIQFEHCVRFRAPVDVCLAYAARVAAGQPALAPVDDVQLGTDARPPLTDGVFNDLSWFDLSGAKDVVGTGWGSSVPRVWVDRVRGVFYFRETD